MIALRLRPNSRVLFNIGSGLPASYGKVVQEKRPFGDDLFPAAQPVEYLVITRTLHSDLDHSLHEAMPINSDPDGHRAVALAYHAVQGYRDGLYGLAGNYDE